MTAKPISLVLQDESHIESHESRQLRLKALSLVKHLEKSPTTSNFTTTTSQFPDTILELLIQVIKPLFSKSQHQKLTATGRKNLVSSDLPTSAIRFLFDDINEKPLWQNGWSTDLLSYVLQSYVRIDDIEVRKKTLEAQFYLIVPAVLQMLDNMDIMYKCCGCNCLELLCDDLAGVSSEILKKSGLTDVFVEALKNDFSMLPTLTPEEESLQLLQALYPAYRSLLRARFTDADVGDMDVRLSDKDEGLRQGFLTLLLRHQLLHALAYLSTGVGAGSTSSMSLSTFLISQVGWVFKDMGIASVVHLQTVLPLLRNVLSDPFATSSPLLLLEAVRALQIVVQVCWVRIRDVWWMECLRGVVGCWLNVVDELEDIKDKERKKQLEEVKGEVKVLGCLLEDVVGLEKFTETVRGMVTLEQDLQPLFDGKIEAQKEVVKKVKTLQSRKPLISEL